MGLYKGSDLREQSEWELNPAFTGLGMLVETVVCLLSMEVIGASDREPSNIKLS